MPLRTITFFIFAAALCGIVFSVQAQTAESTYQGKLTDTEASTATYDFELCRCASATEFVPTSGGNSFIKNATTAADGNRF